MSCLADYREMCETTLQDKNDEFEQQEITAQTLKQWMEKGEELQLIDIRQPHEIQENSINGQNIPLQTLLRSKHLIKKDKKVVVYCRSGERSLIVLRKLKGNTSFNDLYHLKGGMLAWKSMQKPTV